VKRLVEFFSSLEENLRIVKAFSKKLITELHST